MLWDAGGPGYCWGKYELIRTPDINGDGYPDRVEQFNHQGGYCDQPSYYIQVSTKRGDRETLERSPPAFRPEKRGGFVYQTRGLFDETHKSHIQAGNSLPLQTLGPTQFFSPGDLVQVSQGNHSFRARIDSLYFDLDENHRLVKRGVILVGAAFDTFDLNDLTLIQPVTELERKVNRLRTQVEQTLKKKLGRRRRIKEDVVNSYDCTKFRGSFLFENLKEPLQKEVAAIDRQIIHFLTRKIAMLKLDKVGKSLVHKKLQDQLNLHSPLRKLATAYASR